MELFFTLLTMVLAFTNAYMAGKLKASLDIDKVLGLRFDKTRGFLVLLNIIFSLYFIISLYGRGSL